ncbi:hypothetical protein BLA29_004745 [Euroglyphus maynei]|uniref:Protein kinase domain-containing protein n=1 Tax=Euroglyphus maynei TaxID=6958 RepID=A0A1Y3AUK5_EURMA|nr:hypothetical protein BLA29_004745 [Euroglyphus maynei]
MDIVENDLIELESQLAAKICSDETNIEQQGYRFHRQTLISIKANCLYRAEILSRQSNQPIVCKIIPLDNAAFARSRDKENFLMNAIRIIRFVCGYNRTEPRHPMFIHVYEIFKIDSKIYIFMDECQDYNNILYMIKHHQKFTQSEGRKWMQLICDAILFLHRHGIAHRSIKMENILIPIGGDGNEPKLCGLSRSVIYIDRINSNQIVKQKREIRSYDYYHLPPESFCESYYNPAMADLWSLGVLLTAIHTKRYVFNVKSRIDFQQQWKTFELKHKINPIIANLLEAIFHNNPAERLALKAIIDHEYFRVSEDRIEITTDQTTTVSESRLMVVMNNNETKQSDEIQKLLTANESNTNTTIIHNNSPK